MYIKLPVNYHSICIYLDTTYRINKANPKFNSSNSKIPRLLEDEYRYNEAYHSEQNILSFMTQPPDFREVFEWPSTVAWSEQKLTK